MLQLLGCPLARLENWGEMTGQHERPLWSGRTHQERYPGPRVGYPSRAGPRSRTLSASSVPKPPGEPGPVSRTRGLGQG
jgi:hypothetical protein